MVAVAYRKLRKRYNLQEGNIIPIIRREIDVLR
jgi:Mor family transcriptional regulator